MNPPDQTPRRRDRIDGRAIRDGASSIGVAIDDDAARRLAVYLDAMLDENEHVNLTAVRDPSTAVVLHAVDSLAIALAVAEPPRAVFDLGTGNGFPGVACAVLWPSARVVLCDRTQKKLIAIVRCLQLAGIVAEPLWADADQLPARDPAQLAAFDLVVARAVGDPAAVARGSAPLLAPGGRLALWLTAEDRPPVTLAGGMGRERVVRYELPEPARRTRAINVWRKD
ncbi:MAG: class I SAM-dependent methyltransferase [Planctomycetes bacterium]|nr:class I SAM-dependent methyltransferase [Planctomycetota bacterium]